MTKTTTKHAIITGGASGIGFALAKILAKEQCDLTLIGRSLEKLTHASDQLKKDYGIKCEVQQADVTIFEQVKLAIDKSVKEIGIPDLLVTSAGIAKAGYFDTLDLDTFKQLMETNYFGTLNTVKAVLPYMQKQAQGQIVLISSAAALTGVYGYSAYAPSKFAVRGLAEVLRAELKSKNIFVSVVYPPDTDTPQLEDENKDKPLETKKIAETGGILSADEVARSIKQGIDQKKFIITPSLSVALLARSHSLFQPLLNWYSDYKIKDIRPLKPIDNWGLTFSSKPEEIVYPTNEEEIKTIVQLCQKNKKKLRPIGSLYSYTPLVASDSVWVSLEKYSGIISIDSKKLEATIKSGTKLEDLERLLFEKGYALPNMGDINKQTLGGFISTGCHGTGKNLQGFCANITALKIITPVGEFYCDSQTNPEIFKACQISLGALGVVSEITIKVNPAYNVTITKKRTTFEEAVSNLEENLKNNHCYEFFWFPYTDDVLEKKINITQQAVSKKHILKDINDYALENGVLWLLCEVSRHYPNYYRKKARTLIPYILTNSETSMSCYGCYATPRLVKHFEIEYAIPFEKGKETLYQIKKLLENNPTHVSFPVEVRYTKEDEMYLSPSYQRDSLWIAVHAYVKDEYLDLFKECERIFVANGGRPHWGKLHWQKLEQLKEMYPKLPDFLAIRNKLDPDRIFSNEYLDSLLSP
ncbi:MAG: hypothetical protein BGO10_09610 [Chlamydia sp. 32-24]|nr:MAG: hypothetical protein BGO10_09610 [Chlamydia sp. 32-24]